MEKWFAFTAWNQQAEYGFGTDEEADAYADYLNASKDAGLYNYSEIPAEDCAALDSGDDTDGFSLEYALATIRENAEWRDA